jgi:hypothetical protein
MSATVMILRGLAGGGSTPYDGQYLADFDFEAHDGVGEITMTDKLEDAKVFADFVEAVAFYKRQPSCKPLRADGQPNRPLTATNWQFTHVDSIRAGAL